MTFEYVSVQDAKAADGVRMVVVSNVPSPWGEAAKGIFHMKAVPFKAVRLVYDDPELLEWAGQLGGPVVMYNDEAPRSGWAEILLLAERLAPTPALLPSAPEDRAVALGLCHELLGEEGLAWSRRLHSVDLGLREVGGFSLKTAQYLAKKYGHTSERGAAAGARANQLLGMFAARLRAQRAAGSAYYLGSVVSVVDVYAAAALATFAPLPEAQCAMRGSTRKVFETHDEATQTALDPILLEHRDMMYARHLELPLSL
ncbi:MAG: hypothetical protein AAFU79_15765 [Myxococcota bacterium]